MPMPPTGRVCEAKSLAFDAQIDTAGVSLSRPFAEFGAAGSRQSGYGMINFCPLNPAWRIAPRLFLRARWIALPFGMGRKNACLFQKVDNSEK